PFGNSRSERFRFHLGNSSFGYGDAYTYWSMIADAKPRRIIEIGGGFSSGLALDAIDFYSLETQCTFIDPFPKLLRKVVGELDPRHTVVDKRVQRIDSSLFSQLDHNDILFVDSSHVAKTGSDVNHILFNIVPRLKRGTLIHFHDI